MDDRILYFGRRIGRVNTLYGTKMCRKAMTDIMYMVLE